VSNDGTVRAAAELRDLGKLFEATAAHCTSAEQAESRYFVGVVSTLTQCAADARGRADGLASHLSGKKPRSAS
jgi:hypothetical protein